VEDPEETVWVGPVKGDKGDKGDTGPAGSGGSGTTVVLFVDDPEEPLMLPDVGNPVPTLRMPFFTSTGVEADIPLTSNIMIPFYNAAGTLFQITCLTT
jgi:hypothetical protein